MEPYGAVIPWDVGHPVGSGRASLGGELHVPFHLADVLDDLWIQNNVAGGLIVQEVPRFWYAVVGLRKDRALVDLSDRSILGVLGAFDCAFALKSIPAKECPVLGFIVSSTVPVHSVDELANLLGWFVNSVDKLADALIGLLRLAEDGDLVLAGVIFDGGMSLASAALSDLLAV